MGGRHLAGSWLHYLLLLSAKRAPTINPYREKGKRSLLIKKIKRIYKKGYFGVTKVLQIFDKRTIIFPNNNRQNVKSSGIQ